MTKRPLDLLGCVELTGLLYRDAGKNVPFGGTAVFPDDAPLASATIVFEKPGYAARGSLDEKSDTASAPRKSETVSKRASTKFTLPARSTRKN